MRWIQLAAPLATLAVLGPAEPARAVMVRYHWSAEVTLVSYGNAALLPVGTRVSGSFLVETDVPVPPPSPPRIDGGTNKAAYGFDLTVTFEAPGFSFTEMNDSPFLSDFNVVVFDDHECTVEQVDQNLCFPDRTMPTDEINFGLNPDLYDPGRDVFVDFSIRLTDEGPAPTMIEGLGIPSVAPGSPTAVGGGVVWMSALSEESSFELGDLVLWTEVPAPGRAPATALGLVALVRLARRRRRGFVSGGRGP